MKSSIIWCIVLAGLAVIVSGLAVSAQSDDVPVLARIDLSDAAQARDLLAGVYDLPVYAHLQDAAGRDYALVIAPQARLEQSGLSYRILDADARGGEYVLALERRPGARAGAARFVNVLYDDGRQIIVRATPAQAEGLAELGLELERLDAMPLTFRAPGGADTPQAFISNSIVAEMVAQVQPGTVYTYDGLLSGEWPALVGGTPYSFTTRHTASGAPVQKATQYVYEHLQALSLTVSYHNWAYGDTSGRNVIAVLTGTQRSDEIVLVTAHLDDMPPSDRAPGADDNASGSTGVLIAADILSRYRFERTLRFIFFTGEEQGMLGSKQYATLVSNAGENIVAAYNLDMIAWNSTAEPTLRLHTRTPDNPGYSGDLAIADVFTHVVSAYGLGTYLTPIIEPDALGYSDHSSFWNRGYPALLAIEDDVNDWNAFYHTSSDRLATLDLTYFTNYIKASVGTVAHLAYPITPMIVPLASVALSGPTLGTLSSTLYFAAFASPVTATLPVTFVWNATGQTLVTHVVNSLPGSSHLGDTSVYSWTAVGTQAITVTATNAGGSVTDTHSIAIVDTIPLYLPLVLHSYAPDRVVPTPERSPER